jgi:microtubule-associated protein-like 6
MCAQDEVWGLATHPTERRYCTVGDDRTVRVWHIGSRSMLRSAKLEGMARACAYSPNGELLAVGMGGSVGRGRQRVDGTVKVLEANTLKELFSAHDAKEWISDIKFSPDGKLLAAGSHDNSVYVYSVSGGGGARYAFKLRFKYSRHNSYITHLDFSADSQYLQTNCGAYELLFANVQTGQQIPKAHELRDVHWATWTCVLGWPVQGIWPPCADGTDVNSVDRSHVGSLLATGDDLGKVKLFRYPCVQKNANNQEYLGHCSHVTNVRWTAYDECLISTGGNDKCVFQWANKVAGDGGYSVVEQTPGLPRPPEKARGAIPDAFEVDEDIADLALQPPQPPEPSGGDEFMSVKPWLGAIKAPSTYGSEPDSNLFNPRPPKYELQLEWVHGYSGHTTRGNLHYLDGGRVVFPAAALGVVMKADRGGGHGEGDGKAGGAAVAAGGVKFSVGGGGLKHEQAFYGGHERSILALAVCPQKRFVATGQIGG